MDSEHGAEKKRRIMGDYNATSEFYDFRYKDNQFNKMRVLFSRPRKLESPALDFGGGSGLVIDYLVDIEDEKIFKDHPLPQIGNHYVNLDISFEMLKVMLSKTSVGLITDEMQVHAVCGDCENPPFRDHVFPSFISLTTIQNFPDPALGLKELHRITSEKAEGYLTTLSKKFDKMEFADLITSTFFNARIISGNFGEDFAGLLKK